MVEYNVLNASGHFTNKELLRAWDKGEEAEQRPYTFEDVERWTQPTETREQEAAYCEKLVADYFLSGFMPWPRTSAGKPTSKGTEAAEQVRRLLSFALRLRLLLQDRGESITEEDLLALGFTYRKPEGARPAPYQEQPKEGARRVSLYWSFALPAREQIYSPLLEEACAFALPRARKPAEQDTHGVSSLRGTARSGEEVLLLLSLSLDNSKGWRAACAEALLEFLCDLHLARAAVRATVAHGIEIQTTDGLTSLWVALVQSFSGGRLGQCPICGKYFRATNERKNKRVYCESGGGCAQMAARTRSFAASCEKGIPPEAAARGISIRTALKTLDKLGIERREGTDYGE